MVGEQSESFGERLRRSREAAGFSQEELAERAGLSKNAIGALERGERRRPYPDTLRRLAEALGLTGADRARLAAAAASRGGPPSGSSAAAELSGPSTPALPASTEPLIGREREGAEVLHLLGQLEVRLLTLTGPGGVGKTRLAIEAARWALDRFPDGAAFVSLAPLQDPALVIPTVARALGLRESGRQTLREILHGYLRDKELLLVLDNCEHLLPAAPDVAELLLACPRLTLLATSRAPLRLRGEQEYPVPPLGLPDLSRVPPFEDVAQAASVRLFVRRARQVAPAFALAPSTALPVAAICRRLDGLPLAIELAAARVKLLPPAALLERLDHALPLLTGGARDLPARQRTMRDAIAWSYDLLDEREQMVFRRLSVFAGGWTMAAAEAVGTGASAAAERVLEVLCGLVDQSLVVVEQASDRPPRYRMLEPVRQYAAELLGASGEVEAVRSRHAEYYLGLAERGESQLRQALQTAWFDRLEEEHANLRAALERLIEDGPPEASLRQAGALGWFWFVRGYLSEGRAWLRRALTRDGAPAWSPIAIDALSQARVRALHRAGLLAWFQGDYPTACQQLEESLALSRNLGDKAGAAFALAILAVAAQGRRESPVLHAWLEESTALFREADDKWGTACALACLGHWMLEPDAEVVLSRNLESLLLFREVGDRWGTGLALTNLGQVALSRGEHDAALAYFEESLGLYRELRDGLDVAVALTNIGEVARCRGDDKRAEAHYREALARFEEAGSEADVPRLLHNLGRVARRQGDGERAAALLGESFTRFRRLGIHRGVAECIAGFAGLALDREEPERAAALLGAVEALFRSLGTSMWPADRAEYDRDVAAAHARLGEIGFEGACAEGRAMALDQMIACAVGRA